MCAGSTYAQSPPVSIEWVGAPPYVPKSTYYPWTLSIDAISDNGQIVAAHVTEALSHVSIATTTYLWRSSSGWFIASRFPSARVTALSSDANAAIVDELITSGIAQELHRRWWVGSSFVEIPTLIDVSAMNPTGDVAVGYRAGGGNRTIAVHLVRTGSTVDVQDLWATESTLTGRALGVSPDGRAAVGWIGQFDGTSLTSQYAVRWAEGIGLLDRDPTASMYAVGTSNGAGAVVGQLPGPGQGAAGLWDLGRMAWPFAQPPSVYDSAPVAIDASGVVAVGNSRTLINGFANGGEPWVWDRVSHRRSLADVLAPFGVTFDSTNPPYLKQMTSDGRWLLAVPSASGGPDPNATGFYRIHLPAFCYAKCDGSAGAATLGASDFTCFLQRFASGDPYANCDGSTTSPLLGVSDFICFLQKFRAGCPN